jgi:FkbH-like protein
VTALHWLPPPADFRLALRQAAGCAGPERLQRLVALARTRLGFLETLQVDNALRTVESAAAEMPRMRVALLSSGTCDHLLPGIRVGGLRHGLLLDVHLGAFGQFRQELLAPDSPLVEFKPEAVALSIGPRELLAQVAIGASGAEASEAIAATVAGVRELWRQARQRFGALVIHQTVIDTSEPLFGSLDSLVPASPARLITALNAALADAAGDDGVLLLDIARRAARDGLDAWFDAARWLQGKIDIAPSAAPLYGELLARILGAQRGLSRKCLVLDLDNTLWGGVIGDVGIEGIVLGEGSAVGEAHLALQHYARGLKERGIILAVCSKNDPAVAESAFREHPEMALKVEDIAAFVANWTDKAQNLQTIATRLNIGLDSLVFVDDNPAERARIRESLPQVAVPEIGEDPAHYVRCLADAGYFEALSFTGDDRERAKQYQANLQREALQGAAQSMDEFLAGLAMSVVYGPVGTVDQPRVTQLLNKTNQFNTTTRRYTPEEVATRATAADHLVLQFRLADRFGDNGLVSVLLLCPDPDDDGALQIENWVMSCRVFGRQLEHEALNIAAEAALGRGFQRLNASFVPTKKNGVIAKLFATLGFEPGGAEGGANGETTRWTLDLAARETLPTHITRRPQP